MGRGVMGFAFTTSLNVKKASYAFFASASFTDAIKYFGTSAGTSDATAL